MPENLQRFRYLAGFVLAIWVLFVLNVAIGDWFYRFGLEPRRLSGLDGIIGAPWLHAGPAHLFSNTLGLIVLGGLLCLHGAKTFLRVSLFVAIVGGIFTWLIARQGNHIGASGLVFGYFGYLLARGIVERTPKGILIAVIVAVGYSSLLWGVLPNQRGVSWEGHLFGFLAGLLAARWRIHSDKPPGRRI